jgi:hypothetical protein
VVKLPNKWVGFCLHFSRKKHHIIDYSIELCLQGDKVSRSCRTMVEQKPNNNRQVDGCSIVVYVSD